MADLKKMLSELGFDWEQGEELNYTFAESPIENEPYWNII